VITEHDIGVSENHRLVMGPQFATRTSDKELSHSDSKDTETSTMKSKQTGKHEMKFDCFYAEKLVEIAKYYGFDGWFINIESQMDKASLFACLHTYLLV
jgi:endo-beta-N-acetylglucosaminidase D